uniref:52KDa n=1 Tax=Zoothera dauma adenovirus TaxID=3073259 RepID=A0AA51NPI2_9ADEN|nr:52KDa [Zoothera dauma adenovirus]
MHPIVKNVSSALNDKDVERQRVVDCGIANKRDEDFRLRKQQRDDRITSSPPEPVNIFSDSEPKMAEERDLLYKSGNDIEIDTSRQLTAEDFKPDLPGSSVASRHMDAAELYRNAKHTASVERWAHDSFMITCRQLLKRPSTRLGILYLCDFLHSYVENPPRHELAVQMVAIQQHVENGYLRRTLNSIGEKNENGDLKQGWLLELIRVLQLIMEEESKLSNQLAALSVCCNKLSLHFCKKACGGRYPTSDKLSKTNVFFRRLIIAILVLSDKLGCYERNIVPREPKRKVMREIETSDDVYMLNLKNALEGPESDEDDFSSDSESE